MTGAELERRWCVNFDWTPERCAKLAEMWCDGRSGQEIADYFGHGISRSAVIGKVHRLKLPKRGDEERRLKSRAKARREGILRNRVAKPQISPLVPKRLQPLPPLPQEPETASAVKFEALEPHHCRYVVGDEKEKLFCGCNAIPGKAWCEAHFRKVYRPIDVIPVRRREIPNRQKTFYELEKENA